MVRKCIFHQPAIPRDTSRRLIWCLTSTDVTQLFLHSVLLPNLLYAELLSIFDCLTNFPSLPVRSGFDELFPVTTFLTVVQSHDTLISMFLYIT